MDSEGVYCVYTSEKVDAGNHTTSYSNYKLMQINCSHIIHHIKSGERVLQWIVFSSLITFRYA